MELSISTNVIFEREKGIDTNLNRTIRLCSAAGYQVLDFCFHDLTRYDSFIFSDDWMQSFQQLRTLADNLSIKFKLGHAVVYDFCNAKINHSYYNDLMKKCIIGSEILGIEWLVVHPSTDFENINKVRVSKQKNINYFSNLVKFASQHNVKIAVENMWDLHIAPKKLYCTSIEELIDLVDSVEGLGICLDVEHASIMNIDLKLCMEAIGNRLKVLHISDYLNKEDIHLLPYMGKCDWDTVLEALKKNQFNGLFNLEIHRYLVHIPEELFLPALQFSVQVGTKMIKDFQRIKI